MQTQTTTHTPGPWFHNPKLSSVRETHKGFYLTANKGMTIANEIYPLDPNGEEGEANAKLIAAAPELLEAVKELVANMPSNYPGSFDKFLDLIYKAEGK